MKKIFKIEKMLSRREEQKIGSNCDNTRLAFGALEAIGFGKQAREFSEMLQLNGSSIEKFFSQSLTAGFAVSMVLVVVLFAQKSAFSCIVAAAVLPLFGVPLLNFFVQQYLFERKKRQMEQLVPDALLQASAFPRGTSFEKILQYLGNEDFGLLGKEFAKALGEVQRGASVEKALLGMAERNRSSIIERAVSLLLQGYSTGADMSDIFRETASDILETNAILQERNAAMVIEKYTLLFAGGLIVPMVLGLLAGMVRAFDFSALQALGIDRSGTDKAALAVAILLANKVYIGEYALLASFFIASQESDPKKAVLYACALLPLSLAVHTVASGFSF